MSKKVRAHSHGAIFKIQKLDCVVVNDTVHMVPFALYAMHTCV